jgi:beta-lactam-binding protein with PASTA domain
MARKDMADSDGILGRFGSDLQESLDKTVAREDARREAAAQSAKRAARWAGLVRDPDFLRTNAWRAAHLVRAAEETAAVRGDLEVALAGARTLADPGAEDSPRVFGTITSPEAGGEADLIDAEGCTIASSPIDALGGYAIVAEATGEAARLEIRDAKGQRAVLDGRPFDLTPGLTLRRDFTTGRCGRVEPRDPDPPPAPREMPDLVGKSIKDARAKLDDLGRFRINEDRHPDSRPKGTVTGQTPAPGQPLQDGALILLAVSEGAGEAQQMPDLVGATEAEALKILSALDYRSVRFTRVRDPERAGRVTEQSPEPGAELTVQTDVTLCLAVKALLMPHVTGLTRKEALELLVPAYVEAPKIAEEPEDGPPDRVIAQRPKTGEAIEDGVELTVSVRPDPKDDTPAMPRVIGMTRAEALAALVPAYAKEIAFDERPERGRAGIVVAQVPEAGIEAPKDIRLTLSAPIKDDTGARMPDLRGKPLDVARKVLRPMTVAVEIEERPDRTAPGTVLDQRPAPGQPVNAGVTLIVAVPPKEEPRPRPAPSTKDRTTRRAAKAPKKAQMPDLTGLALVSARKALAEAGLAEPDYDSATARKRGHRVVAQTPRPGAPVSPGDPVALTFGKPEDDGSA